MKELFIGETIKKRRIELGLTQEQLCEGICEPITVSRLENGKQTPSRNRINAMLERLDIPTDRFYALLSKNEMELDTLHRQITTYNIQFRQASSEKKPEIRAQALKAHQELESVIADDDNFSKQLILRSRVILGTEDGVYSFEDKKRMLLEAIRLTAPGFDLDDIGRGLYTVTEIKIITQLALAYSNAKEHMEAIGIFSQLYKYIQKHFQNSLFTRARLSIVDYNYARELDYIDQFRKAIEIAEVGQKVCIDYGHYLLLPELLAIQADCYHALKDDITSRDYYYQAYYLMKITGDDNNLQILKRKAKKDLNIDLEC